MLQKWYTLLLAVFQNSPNSSSNPTALNALNQGRITVSSNCPNSANMLNGSSLHWIITTPNFPDQYPLLSNCHWTIFTEPGYQVSKACLCC